MSRHCRTPCAAPNVCANCGASDDSSPDGVKLKPCSVCKTARYCGRGCQVEHWKKHRPHCTAETPAARAAARAAALADLPDLVPLPGAPDLVSCLSSPSSWRFDAAVGLVPLEVYNTWRAAEAQRLSAMHKAISLAKTTLRPPVRSSPVVAPSRTRSVQVRLGQAFEFGEGNVATDLEVALSCYQDSADGGDLDAQCRLGFAYMYGSLGLKIDFDMALRWFKKAAACGHSTSQWRLGVAYENGDLGVVTNFKMALMWFREAAVGGDDDAQRRLGRAYRDGTLGLETDLEAATTWLQVAGDSEDEEEEEEPMDSDSEDDEEEEEEEEGHGEEEADRELWELD